MLADLVEVNSQAKAVTAPRTQAAPANAAPTGAKRLLTRRQLLAGIFPAAALISTGAYATQVEPFWVDYHDYPMPLRKLPPAFAGFRLTQLTDLHSGDDVPLNYLKGVIEKVVAARPDLVAITGDLVTHSVEYAYPICDALGALTAAGIQSVATFGNHDYEHGEGGFTSDGELSDMLQHRLERNGITVLRNSAMPIVRNGERFWLVGLEDLWSGRFSPAVAFAGVPANEPIIALSHNPDTADELDGYGTQWILSGHTHGGQVRVPGVGALLVNVQNTQYQKGEYALPHSKMYISRGVGYLRRVRLMCRPEVPTFVLQPTV